MIAVQKLFLLCIIASIVVFNSTGKVKKGFSESEIQYQSDLFNIDSIKESIVKTGFNSTSLKAFDFYLANTSYNLQSETQFLNRLNESPERNYLLALILKMQNKFDEMNALLVRTLKLKPQFFPFYTELVNSAQINDKLAVIKLKEERQIPAKFVYYTNSLVLSSLGKFEEAAKEIKKSIQISSNDFEPYFQQAIILRNLGNYEQALSSVTKSIQLAQNDFSFINKALVLKGSLYYLSEHSQESKKIYLQALSNSKKTNDKVSATKALINIGIIEDEEGNVETAREKFNEVLKLAEQINDIEITALAYSELGVSYAFTNQLIDAKETYLKSIELFKKMNNKIRLSFLYSNLGRIYQSYYNFHEALNSFENGIKLAGENKRASIQNLTGLADINMNLSNYSKALEFYDKAKQLATEIKAISLEADIDYGIGSLNYNLNLPMNAIRYFNKVEKQYEQTENIFELPNLYDKMGLAYVELDSMDMAEKYFKKAILSAEKVKNPLAELNSKLNWANLVASKEPATAEKLLSKLNIPRENIYSDLESQKNLLLGKIKIAQSDFKIAAHYLQIAEKIAAGDLFYETQIECNYELARLYEKSKNLSLAEKYYITATNLIEINSRSLFGNNEVQITYFAGKNQIYNSLAELYIKTGQFENALLTIENARARNTNENLKNLTIQKLVKDKTKLNKLYELDWELHSGLYVGKEDSLKNEFEHLKKSIVDKNPRTDKYLTLHKRFSVIEFQKELPEKEFLISIHSSDSLLTVFILGKESFDHYQLKISKQEMSKLLSRITPYLNENSILQDGLINQDLFSFNTAFANRFYSLVLKRALDNIPKNSKLIFSLSSELLSIPFELLVTDFNPANSPYNYKNIHYLIFDYDISYTSSIDNYFELRKNFPGKQNEILLVGDPLIENTSVYSERRGLLNERMGQPRNINLLPLKYSKEEIMKIDNSIGSSQILLSKDATESNFKKLASASKIIHLSTHSFLNENQPVIFFSNKKDKENDGFLELGEIIQLNLNCDLVVLSSCNSGKGLVDKAEGILGTTKAFYESGSKSVVVSLWDVNDKYTSVLMSLFYNYLAEGLDKSESLRRAKIEFIKEYSPNPYFWASFILNGNIDKIKVGKHSSSVTYLTGLLVIILLIVSLYLLRKKFALRKIFLFKN